MTVYLTWRRKYDSQLHKLNPHVNRVRKHSWRREREHYGEMEKNWGQQNKRKRERVCVRVRGRLTAKGKLKTDF